jgi:cysteine-rich repeat protein
MPPMFDRRPVRCASALLLMVSGCCFEMPGKPGKCIPLSSGGGADGDTTTASASTTNTPSTASETMTISTAPTESTEGSMSASMSATGTVTDGTGPGSTDSSESTGSTTSAELCGNGTIDPGEVCDQGDNLGGYNGCKSDCLGYDQFCGDNTLDPVEGCDDGNDIDTDTCIKTCTDANDVTSCTCTAAVCGDGKVQADMEVCDDGNQIGNDGCPEMCQAKRYLVFVTAGKWSGNLGGLAGADAKCQAEAETSKLKGTYRAWLSTSEKSAKDRLGLSTGPNIPFELRGDSTVAMDWSDLTTADNNLNYLLSSISTDANGNPVGNNSTSVWTHTAPDGSSLGGSDCKGWTDSTTPLLTGGNGTLTKSVLWTAEGSKACFVENHLYCFQISYQDPPERP